MAVIDWSTINFTAGSCSIKLAKQLIDAAVDAAVDAIKFQTFKTQNLVSKNAQKAQYSETMEIALSMLQPRQVS